MRRKGAGTLCPVEETVTGRWEGQKPITNTSKGRFCRQKTTNLHSERQKLAESDSKADIFVARDVEMGIFISSLNIFNFGGEQ